MNIDFQKVLAHSPNPYVILDPSLNILWANNAYLRVTGRNLGEIEGRGMFEAFPSEGESYRQLKSSFERVLTTGEPDEIAHIPYQIPNAEGGFDTHVWSATHTPFLDGEGNVEYVLQHTVKITGMDQSGSERDAAGVARRAEAVEQRYQGATKQLERFRALLEQAPGFVAVVSGRSHRFIMANAAYRQLVGQRDLVGKTVAEALPEVIDQGFVTLLDKVHENDRPYFGKRERVLLKTGDNDELEARFLEFIYQPIHGAEGFRGILVQGHDVTEEVAFEEHQRVLINELNHRVKNTLAVVQSLAHQSFRDNGGSHGLKVFTDRIAALASAHNLLTERSWESADLRTIVEGSLEAAAGFDSARYSLDGPSVVLAPQAAVALSMIVHELSTNALKYGALSNDEGFVDITWNTENTGKEKSLIIDWQEHGGPVVDEPSRSGFGTRLIKRGLGSPQSRTSIDYRDTGLHCRIEGRI
ncbi:PAS domain-containing protein [Qipengyuania huizhouensis]|uniref:PAS domain-containing protein n=1 Tax=Qipengyuania huizhouensis TaxID=2867245 RepID=UPI001C86A3C9|nr:PAS domain-containing protein [Qipengyuania huizhouensis]MBX7460425.1 PAS domain-containing protein [Qipengyuania huizhouensis]